VAGTFTIDAFNVKAKVEPGKTSRIEFTPGRGGDFPFRIVGSTPGAAEMKGTLVVVP
jgi:heme/copper-type cytochrome/quinol oxidase subunit 2